MKDIDYCQSSFIDGIKCPKQSRPVEWRGRETTGERGMFCAELLFLSVRSGSVTKPAGNNKKTHHILEFVFDNLINISLVLVVSGGGDHEVKTGLTAPASLACWRLPGTAGSCLVAGVCSREL